MGGSPVEGETNSLLISKEGENKNSKPKTRGWGVGKLVSQKAKKRERASCRNNFSIYEEQGRKTKPDTGRVCRKSGEARGKFKRKKKVRSKAHSRRSKKRIWGGDEAKASFQDGEKGEKGELSTVTGVRGAELQKRPTLAVLRIQGKGQNKRGGRPSG